MKIDSDIRKLKEEGLIHLEGNKIKILGEIWFHSHISPVYGGGIVEYSSEVTFHREGRKKDIKVELVDLLESLNVTFGTFRIVIEKIR